MTSDFQRWCLEYIVSFQLQVQVPNAETMPEVALGKARQRPEGHFLFSLQQWSVIFCMCISDSKVQNSFQNTMPFFTLCQVRGIFVLPINIVVIRSFGVDYTTSDVLASWNTLSLCLEAERIIWLQTLWTPHFARISKYLIAGGEEGCNMRKQCTKIWKPKSVHHPLTEK